MDVSAFLSTPSSLDEVFVIGRMKDGHRTRSETVLLAVAFEILPTVSVYSEKTSLLSANIARFFIKILGPTWFQHREDQIFIYGLFQSVKTSILNRFTKQFKIDVIID